MTEKVPIRPYRTLGDAVEIERHGAVLLVWLNRGDRHNAIGGTMLRDLADAFEQARTDDSIKVLVTIGRGDYFCVGADVEDFDQVLKVPPRELLSGDRIGGDKGLPLLSRDQQAMDDLGNAGRWAMQVWELEKPTIAAINGAAVGGGFALSLLHDIRVAASSARLGGGFSRLGLSPEMGMSWILPRLVGLSSAADILFTSKLLSGEEAQHLGLVSDCVPDEDLLAHTMEIADQISKMPSVGLQQTKRLLRRAGELSFVQQLRAEYSAQLVLFDNSETKEALQSMSAKLASRKSPSHL